LLNKYPSAPNYMKTKKILIAAGITLTALLIIQLLKNKKAEKKRLSVVAEEGYETAEDILFPKKKFIRLG
jgi:spore coat polysaccharide biosynthesis predicted glycosyltransferase SpsG